MISAYFLHEAEGALPSNDLIMILILISDCSCSSTGRNERGLSRVYLESISTYRVSKSELRNMMYLSPEIKIQFEDTNLYLVAQVGH